MASHVFSRLRRVDSRDVPQPRTQAAYTATFDEFDRVVGLKQIQAIHLNDSKKELGSRVDRHEHIGKGQIGLEAFRLLMNDRRLADIPMVLETPKDKECTEDILNLKVKHRENFRPFAPVISREDVHDYFEIDKDEEPFMLFVYPFKEKVRHLVPSVVHVDGSGRLQTTSKEENHLYYGVIKEFEKLSKVPILVNTSFNIRGEPIVCTPEDAYRCMMGTGIDYLVMDKFLIKRDENKKDMWDSENIATD